MSPLSLAFSALSPAGPRAGLNIFIFHRVLPEPDPLFPGEVDAERFKRMLGWLRDWFKVLPLDEAIRLQDQGRLPARAAAITFDDGYADNHDIAMPLLEEAGMNASFFIATGFLDGGRMWNDSLIEAVRHTRLEHLDVSDLAPALADLPLMPVGSWEQRRQAVKALIGRVKYLEPELRLTLVEAVLARAGVQASNRLMMSSAQVRAMRKRGMVIGAHTVNHPILAGLDDAQARQEILSSKQTLEALLDERVGLFAYPNGKPGVDYSPASVAVARACGFDAAVSTRHGVARRDTDRFELPRFTPWDPSRWRFGLRMAQHLALN